MNAYDPGSIVTISVAFTNASGAPVAPSSVTLRVQNPAGTETDYTTSLTNVSTGVYTQPVTPLISGIWRYRWEATGAVAAATDGAFVVTYTPFSAPN